MKDNKLKVVIVEPNKEPYAAEIGDDLKSLQKVVGGYIETVPLDRGVELVCNDSGKLIGLRGNRHVGNHIIAGTFFVCGVDDEDFCSLTDRQIEKYSEQFRQPELILDEEVAEDMTITVISM